MKERMGKFRSGLLIAFVLILAVAAGVIAFLLSDTSGTHVALGPEYTYDIKQYAEIDPALILYRQVGETIETDFENTHAIAVDAEGRIYVAGDERIAVYSADGNVIKQIELGAEPTCLAIDGNGGMIVGLSDTIEMLDAPGVETARWKAPMPNALLTSIATDKNNIFAADAVNKVIWRFDRKGNVIGKVGEKDEKRNIPGIVIPSPYFDITMAPDGLLRVVNPGRHLIEAYTVQGDREWFWGKASVGIEGFSGCCNPINFALLPDGGFVTCEKGLVRVKVYDADGHFVGVVAGPDQLGWVEPLRVCETPEQCSSKGFDVAADSDGRIYILDMVRKNVRIFEKE
ncbi:MAG: hypothetical protein ISS71_05805 [Phycisphaerae bacterium]|nr:hypothetical protein [Phycisphaerae bacterium]